MNLLLIGTGSIGLRHLANVRFLCPNVHVYVLREGCRATSLDIEALGCHVSVVTSLDEAIRIKLDLMVIANPTSMHLRYLIAAIEHGVPFYIEKPVLSSLDEVEQLKQCINRMGGRLPPNQVGCNLRFLPSLVALRSLVRSGGLGRIAHASFEAGQWLPDWRPKSDYRSSYSAKRSMGGGVSLDLIHEIDAARWILGEFIDVHGALGYGSSLGIETEDCACFVMKSEAGSLATVQLDYVSRQPFRRYRIVGDLGTAEWDMPKRYISVSSAEGCLDLSLDHGAFDVGQTYIAAMRELISAIETSAKTSLPIAEGIASLELVLKAKLISS
ncbi:Gfo/Idh/MocA family protein [Chitinimonas taiwanensis]|nr:Gfo/Idh/MocA family oxidoreductase [Chitinimonas taiwanensis]